MRSRIKNLNRRLDFLLQDMSEQDANDFKAEYLTKKSEVNEKQNLFELQIASLTAKRDELTNSEFDWKRAAEKAKKADGYQKQENWIKLRASYQALFQSIVLGAKATMAQDPYDLF